MILGVGPKLIMLHGWGDSSSVLVPLAEALATEVEVHVLDLPGFGASPAPAEVWGTKDYAQAVVDYMDQMQLAEACIVGHSFGGRVAIQLAGSWPSRVSKLVLIASAGLRPKRSWPKKLRLWFIKLISKGIRLIERFWDATLVRESFIRKFGSADYQQAGALRPILVRTVNEDLAEEATRISARTLLLWGDLDQDTPIEMARRFEQLIPNSHLVLLSNKGHRPFLGGGAQLCAYHLKRFLRNYDN